MLEIFANWEWWQIALTAVFGTVWIVFIILDQRRKVAAKKLKARREQELREQGSEKSRRFVSKDGEK